MAPKDPVFIVGGARSGTTFLAKLLDSHPDVLYRHEPDWLLVNTEIPFLPRQEDLPKLAGAAKSYLEALCHVRATKVAGQRPIFDKSYRSPLQKQRFLAGLYLAKAAEKVGRRFFKKPLSVADCIDANRNEDILYLIKSVNSPWRTRLFSEAMPNWRFIHILRHPCAVINSRLRGIESKLMDSQTYLRPVFEAGMAEGYPFSLEELEARSYEEKAAFLWMACNQRIHDDMAGRAGYQMVIYENLCRDLEATTRQLFDFAGLSWDPQTLRFIQQLEAKDAQDVGYFDVQRSPLASLDKWRDQLSQDQIARIEKIVCHAEIGRQFFNGS